MKATRLTDIGTDLELVEIPDPAVPVDGVRIDVESAHVPTFTDSVLAGEGPFEPPTPITPGPSAVGVVNAVGDGVTGVAVGDRVFCDPRVVSRTHGRPSAGMLIGWFGYTPGADALVERWGDGAWAEQATHPAECVTVLDGTDADDAAALANLNPLAIAYGALDAADVAAGDRVLVNGATGQLGSCTVVVALAAGASAVAAVGRNPAALDRLDALDDRVTSVPAGDDHDAASITEAVGSPDVVVDFLGHLETAAQTGTALDALAPGGTAVFAGGVRTEIPVAYQRLLGADQTITGSFMYPRDAPATLFRMADSGVIDLTAIETGTYSLSTIDAAINAAADIGALQSVVVTPET